VVSNISGTENLITAMQRNPNSDAKLAQELDSKIYDATQTKVLIDESFDKINKAQEIEFAVYEK
jgi:hypothetical protein